MLIERGEKYNGTVEPSQIEEEEEKKQYISAIKLRKFQVNLRNLPE